MLTGIKAETISGDDTAEKIVRTYTYGTYGKVREIKDYRNLFGNNDKAVKKIYTYNNAGNRMSEDDGITKTTYIYNGLDQLKTFMKARVRLWMK